MREKKVYPKKKAKKKLIIVLTVVFISCGLIALGANTIYNKICDIVEVDSIYKNIYINEVNVGELNKDDAYKKALKEIQEPIDQKIITFKDKDNDTDYEFTFKDFNAAYKIREAVQKAYDYARDGMLLKRYEKIIKLKDNPVKLSADYVFDDEFAKSKLSELESKVYIKPVNASVQRQNGTFITSPGKDGRKLNIEATFPELKKILEQKESGTIELIFESVKPFYTEKDFDNVRDVLGSYTTSFDSSQKSQNRNTNISNAARKINNCVVYPSDIFSMNNMLKPFTAKNGYKNAPVIVDGKTVDDLGGGICQVSTALYNAVLRSELKVTERQNHSLKVGYADYGYDATLAGDYIDFKFQNSTKSPILIESIIGSNSLTIKIYGAESRSSTRKISFQNELIETVKPPSDAIIYTDELPDGEKQTVRAPKTGYKYKLYKIVSENGKQTDRVLINSSYYKPVRGTVKVGTKK